MVHTTYFSTAEETYKRTDYLIPGSPGDMMGTGIYSIVRESYSSQLITNNGAAMNTGGGDHSNSTGFEGFKQEAVDFASDIVGNFSTIIGGAAHYSDMIKTAGKVGVVGEIATTLSYGHALWTNQAQPSHHLDAVITGSLLTLSAIPLTAPFGVTAGFIYGGARLVGGEAFDQWFNKQFSNPTLSTPNKINP
jgi:hypothetical protein